MKSTKYILTKHENIRRIEKVEYEIEIPEKIKNKMEYADEQVLENNYNNYKIVDIIDSEMLDEEIVDLRKNQQRENYKIENQQKALELFK